MRDLAAAAAAPRNATPVRPTAMILVPHAPIAWDGIDVAGADHRQLVAAARGLAESRDALLGLLNARAAEDGQGPGHEVVLDLIDAMAFYDNHQVRPMPIVAPQWRDLAGQSLGRIRAPLNYDYVPGREDVRMSLQRTGPVRGRSARWRC